jgi:hypothetical protein
MGSLPRAPLLTPAQIAEQYKAGHSRGLIGLRARLPDHRIVEILRSAGVPLRTAAEVKAVVSRSRTETMRRRRR